MATRFILPFADVGKGITPSSGAELFFFDEGTSTPRDTFSDSAATIPNTNPVIANSSGVFSDIFIKGVYKVILQDNNGSQIWEADPIHELITGSGQENNVLSRGVLDDAITDISLIDGLSINVAERTLGGGGGSMWDVTPIGTTPLVDLPDTFGVIQLTGVSGLVIVIRDMSGYFDPLKLGASTSDVTKNAPVFQYMLDNGVGIISHLNFEIDAEINVPGGSRINFLKTGGIYCSDGFMTNGTGNSLLINEASANDILYEGMELNGNAGPIDFAKWPNTDTTGNEASVGLSRPVKLMSCTNNTNLKIKGCRFINAVGGAIKEFASSGGRDLDIDDCYWDLIRGNCVDGDYEKLIMTRQQINLIGDIRLATRGGLIVTASDDVLVTDINIRQTTDSAIYLSGSDRGKAVVSDVYILYSGKDAVKVLTGTKDTVFGNINVTAAGKTPVGFFGGTVANGVLGNIKVGFDEGDAPTDILDQTDVTWSTPKTITACNIQEAKWNEGGGFGGQGFAVSDSNVAFSNVVVSSYTGIGINVSGSIIASGNIVVSFGDGPAIYQTSSSMNMDNITIKRANQNVALSPFSLIHAMQLLGTGNLNATTINFSDLGGGLLITGPDTFKLNIDDIIGNDFNSKANSDAHLIYLNSAASPLTVTDVNISNVSVAGSATAGRMLYARNLTGLQINNWNSTGGSEGIRLQSCEKVNVSNVIIKSSATDGFRASDCINISLSNVQGHDNTGTGVKTDSNCTDVIAIGCQGSGNATQISILGTNVKPSVISDFNIG